MNYLKFNDKIYPCGVSLAMNLLGGKWKAVILFFLKDGEKRYNELLKEINTITEMTLSLQLRQLEQDCLISRRVYGDKPPVKVIYQLTNLGLSIIPILMSINEWGNELAKNNGELLGKIPPSKIV